MPKGNIPKRESKKPKKSESRKIVVPNPTISSETVEVIEKRRKRKEEE